jgi:hypothetical protein
MTSLWSKFCSFCHFAYCYLVTTNLYVHLLEELATNTSLKNHFHLIQWSVFHHLHLVFLTKGLVLYSSIRNLEPLLVFSFDEFNASLSHKFLYFDYWSIVNPVREYKFGLREETLLHLNS